MCQHFTTFMCNTGNNIKIKSSKSKFYRVADNFKLSKFNNRYIEVIGTVRINIYDRFIDG